MGIINNQVKIVFHIILHRIITKIVIYYSCTAFSFVIRTNLERMTILAMQKWMTSPSGKGFATGTQGRDS